MFERLIKNSKEYNNITKELETCLNEKQILELKLNKVKTESNYFKKQLYHKINENKHIEDELNQKTTEYCTIKQELNNQIKEQNNTITELNQKITEYSTIKQELNNQIKEQNNTITELTYYKKLYLTKIDSLKKINIGYILAGFPTLSQTFVLNELRWLKENGFNVKVFSYIDAEKPVTLDFELETYRFDTTDDLMGNLEKLIQEHDIDLLHTHFVWPTCTKFTYHLAKKLRIPFTFFAHAFDIFIKDIDKKNKLGEITNSEFCQGIFTLSEFHRNYLLQRNVPKHKIFITKQASNYEISPLKKKNNKIKNIISISRFVEKKGIDTLIDAAKLLEEEDLEFNIYGFGNLKKEYQSQINNLKLNNVHLKGSLNGFEEVKKIFENADLLVSPCKVAKNGDMDGIPTIIFEAMGFGVPVLTTNVSAIPEVIYNNKNGFITKPEIPELLALKIKEITKLSNEELYEIRKRAQEDVQKFSSVENTMNNVLKTWSGIFKLR